MIMGVINTSDAHDRVQAERRIHKPQRSNVSFWQPPGLIQAADDR